MTRYLMPSACALALLVLTVEQSTAQEWRPPSRDMPSMPPVAQISPEWMSQQSGWFAGAAPLAGVSASALRISGEPRRGSPNAQVVRASAGPLPVVVWQDRNGDNRADMIEIFKTGGVILQLIDADYDGQANVLRIYDTSGALVREDRM
jgi:hypothetical protein